MVDTTVWDFVGAQVPGLDPDTHPLELGATDLQLMQFHATVVLGRPVILADEPDVGLEMRG